MEVGVLGFHQHLAQYHVVMEIRVSNATARVLLPAMVGGTAQVPPREQCIATQGIAQHHQVFLCQHQLHHHYHVSKAGWQLFFTVLEADDKL